MDINEVKVELISGTWKKDETKTWSAVKVTVGTWSTMIFPKTSFEMDYIKTILGEQKK